jgi:putative acetyltransferase
MTPAAPAPHFRPARPDDIEPILALYRTVAAFLTASLATGVCVVAEDPAGGELAGEIHAQALGPRSLAHVLGELTVAVHPAWQGRGVGRRLFEQLFAAVERDRPGVHRVELKARESNARAIRLYESLGFRIEGRLEDRIRRPDGALEADVPMAWLR